MRAVEDLQVLEYDEGWGSSFSDRDGIYDLCPLSFYTWISVVFFSHNGPVTDIYGIRVQEFYPLSLYSW